MTIELISTINVLLSTYKSIKALYEKADYIELKSHILKKKAAKPAKADKSKKK